MEDTVRHTRPAPMFISQFYYYFLGAYFLSAADHSMILPILSFSFQGRKPGWSSGRSNFGSPSRTCSRTSHCCPAGEYDSQLGNQVDSSHILARFLTPPLGACAHRSRTQGVAALYPCHVAGACRQQSWGSSDSVGRGAEVLYRESM